LTRLTMRPCLHLVVARDELRHGATDAQVARARRNVVLPKNRIRLECVARLRRSELAARPVPQSRRDTGVALPAPALRCELYPCLSAGPPRTDEAPGNLTAPPEAPDLGGSGKSAHVGGSCTFLLLLQVELLCRGRIGAFLSTGIYAPFMGDVIIRRVVIWIARLRTSLRRLWRRKLARACGGSPDWRTRLE
jgi:hypothetical protein